MLAAAVLLLAAALAYTLLAAADSALSVWQRLQSMPGWMRGAYLTGLAALGLGGGWFAWRLLHPAPVRAPKAAPIDRVAIEHRIERVAAARAYRDAPGRTHDGCDDARNEHHRHHATSDRAHDAAIAARRELVELDTRRAEGIVQIALFGEVSSGKSSLLRALAPQAQAAIDVIGGSTREVTRHRGVLPDGRALEIADVPGLHEAHDEPRAPSNGHEARTTPHDAASDAQRDAMPAGTAGGTLLVGNACGKTHTMALEAAPHPSQARIVREAAAGRSRADLARDEAARSHAVVYVADGDLTRAQDAQLQALVGYGRPLLLVLNKIDRYRAQERTALLARLRERYAGVVTAIVAANAGFEETVTREHTDGRRESVVRERPADIALLQSELDRIARAGVGALEPGREAALFARVDAQLAHAEREQRTTQSDATVAKYTRRAVVGALAAVAPGSDLVIQGALATALVRELAAIHQLPVRDLDIDAFLTRAGGLVRTTTSITLAVAGNALKAFPGLGTIGGGLLHAVAYGLIFDSLGHAVAGTFAATAGLDRDETLRAFRAGLEQPAADRLKSLASLALDAWRENSR